MGGYVPNKLQTYIYRQRHSKSERDRWTQIQKGFSLSLGFCQFWFNVLPIINKKKWGKIFPY